MIVELDEEVAKRLIKMLAIMPLPPFDQDDNDRYALWQAIEKGLESLGRYGCND